MDGFLSALLDGDYTLIILAASGLGFLGILAEGLLRGRSDVRRRAAEGLPQPDPGKAKPTAAQARSTSLDRLVTQLETSLAGDDANRRLVRQQLIRAGFFDPRAVPLYFAARLVAAIVLVGIGLLALPMVLTNLVGTHLWLIIAALGIVGYFAPTIWLRRRVAERAIQHRMGFPDFMDLLVVCAEAGLPIEAAIDRVARELVEGHPSLAENLYMASLEIRAGKPFVEALSRMGERLGIEEATMLAALLQQSMELGTSLSQSLRVYSDEMRHKRMSRAEEKAYALPAKLVVPLTLFVFPVLILTLLYPAAMRLMTIFGS